MQLACIKMGAIRSRKCVGYPYLVRVYSAFSVKKKTQDIHRECDDQIAYYSDYICLLVYVRRER